MIRNKIFSVALAVPEISIKVYAYLQSHIPSFIPLLH